MDTREVNAEYRLAKENGLIPFEYLTYIFRQAPDMELTEHPEHIVSLLPNAAPDYCHTAAAPH